MKLIQLISFPTTVEVQGVEEVKVKEFKYLR